MTEITTIGLDLAKRGSDVGECKIVRSHERFRFSLHGEITPPERVGQIM
jgi:hypothetical protein